jgi:hypothetical protein
LPTAGLEVGPASFAALEQSLHIATSLDAARRTLLKLELIFNLE